MLMSKHCTSVREVVSTLGGARKVASIFDRHENAVWNWVSANRFPANTYIVLTKALAEVPATAPDDLWAMARAVRQPGIAA
jgi:hypothetical protein